MKLYIIVLMSCVLCAVQASRASEFGEVEFVLLVHRDVAVGQVMGRIPDSNDTISGNNLFPCANTYVGMTPRLKLGKAGRYLPKEWVDRVKTLGDSKRHELKIRNDDYFPRAMIIKAGDTITDPEFGKVTGSERINGFRLDDLVLNSPSTQVKDYIIHRPEPRPIKICNGTHRNRLSYVFVMDHNVGGISDINGLVTLWDLPFDVAIPMEIQYPWRPVAEFRVESSTLSFDDRGRFDLTLKPTAKNRHVIHILPSTLWPNQQ